MTSLLNDSILLGPWKLCLYKYVTVRKLCLKYLALLIEYIVEKTKMISIIWKEYTFFVDGEKI